MSAPKLHHSRNRKKHKTNPYFERLARPRLGIITPKYIAPDQLLRQLQRCHCPKGVCNPPPPPPRNRHQHQPAHPSDRIVALAKPVTRNISPKYQPRPWRPKLCRCATVIRPEQQSTRTEQLALPYIRLLLDTKRNFRPVMPAPRTGILNKTIQRSMHTVYSRLANVKMPERRQPRASWGEADWKRHNDWLACRARPKRTFSDGHMRLKPTRNLDYDRLDSLARPRRPVPIYRDPGHKVSDPVNPISRAVLNFEMTPHYTWLATPFKPRPEEEEFEQYENPYDVPREYAKVTTVGIKALAEPRIKSKRYQRGDNASVVFEVSAPAMKAKPSEYTKKLAEPRKDMQEEPKPNPYGVAKAAVSRKPMPPAKVEYYAKLAKPHDRK